MDCQILRCMATLGSPQLCGRSIIVLAVTHVSGRAFGLGAGQSQRYFFHVSIPGLRQFPVANTPNCCLLAMCTVACGQTELWVVGMLS